MNPDTPESPSRRDFFRRFARPVKDVTEVELPESPFPRPPWARVNAEFMALCTHCNQCIEHCPQRVLRASDESDDNLQKLPVLILEYGVCDFCGQCVDHCPSGALHREEGVKLQVIAQVNDHCQRKYQPHCNLCVEACEAQAITLTENRLIQVDANRCTGCGVCSLDCYIKAISLVKRS